MSKKQIALLYTGGTIGMVDRDGRLEPPETPDDFLELAPTLSEDFHFERLLGKGKDSTNINHRDWTTIATAIHEGLDKYAGFVVAHGTDTMHFTASAVAFALGKHLPCPIVFTGAQTIPTVEHGDARVNLLRAFEVVKEDVGEVVISFGEYVYRAVRAQKKDEAKFDAFEAPAGFPLAYITEKIRLGPDVVPTTTEPRESFRPEFADGILQVSLIPGLSRSLVEPSLQAADCKGLILQSFGAGNVPNEGEFELISLIRHCAHELRKPVIVTSQFPANPTLHTAYGPGQDAVEAGAIPTGNMTSSCAVAKFRWALAQAKDFDDVNAEVARIMGEVLVREMDVDVGDSHD